VEALEGRQLLAANPLQAVPLLPLPGPGGGGGTGGGGVPAQTDLIPPTAQLVGNALDPSSAGYDIDIRYNDDTDILDTSIDNNDIRVTGPNNYNQLATLRFITVVSGTRRVAHYQIPNPTTFGAYTVTMQNQQVQDTSGNFVVAGMLGSFVAGSRPAGGGGGGRNFGPPDLTVAISNTPSKAATLSPNSLTFRISNLGNFETPGKVPVSIYLSQNRGLDSADTLVVTKNLPRIDGGETKKVTVKFDVPDVVAGGYYFVVQVDPNNVILERIETNNIDLSETQATISPPFIDLTPSILGDLPPTVVGGAPGQTTVRVTNKGTATFRRTLNISLFASADGILDTSDPLVGTATASSVSIAPAAGKNVRVNFRYPTGVQEGNYFLIARADTDNTVVDSDPSNNFAIPPQSVLIRPPFIDLQANTIQVVSGPLGAGTNRVDVSLSNLGNVTAAGNLTISLSASTTNTNPSGVGDVLLGQTTHSVSIPSQKSARLRIAFTLPPNLPRGVYFLHAMVDQNQQFSERDETNNSVFTLNPYPTP